MGSCGTLSMQAIKVVKTLLCAIVGNLVTGLLFNFIVQDNRYSFWVLQFEKPLPSNFTVRIVEFGKTLVAKLLDF